jgi:hypothetical protein
MQTHGYRRDKKPKQNQTKCKPKAKDRSKAKPKTLMLENVMRAKTNAETQDASSNALGSSLK